MKTCRKDQPEKNRLDMVRGNVDWEMSLFAPFCHPEVRALNFEKKKKKTGAVLKNPSATVVEIHFVIHVTLRNART